MNRINSLSFDTAIGDIDIHVETLTAEIEDETEAASKNGRPDGTIRGAVSCNGEITIDRTEFKKLIEAARNAGSYQEMEEFDVVCFASEGDDEYKVELFGCRLKISSLLNIDKSSADKSMVSIPFDVTGEDFVKIDGVSYIAKES